MRTLLLEIELPDFFVSDDDSEEDVEIAMDLANHLVACTFAAHDGDAPGVVLRTLEGRIHRVRIRDTSNQDSEREGA